MRRVASATGDNGPNPFSVKTQETPFTQRSHPDIRDHMSHKTEICR